MIFATDDDEFWGVLEDAGIEVGPDARCSECGWIEVTRFGDRVLRWARVDACEAHRD